MLTKEKSKTKYLVTKEKRRNPIVTIVNPCQRRKIKCKKKKKKKKKKRTTTIMSVSIRKKE